MRYLLLIISLMGGLLSFNSFAADCLSGVKLSGGSYKPFYTIKNPISGEDNFININGCEYKNIGAGAATSDGYYLSYDGFISTGKPAKSGSVPVGGSEDKPGSGDSGDFDTPDTKPDNPDTGSSGSGGSTTVIPPALDTGSSGGSGGSSGSSGFSAALSSINSSSVEYLYNSYFLTYDYRFTSDQNMALAQAFLSKLSNVTPPSYYVVDKIRRMMEHWHDAYSYMRTSTGPYHVWNSSKFVSGEHRYLGSVVLSVSSCSRPDILGYCPDIEKPLDIHDPDYANLIDYRHGVTRCMRNPHDSSCYSSDDSSGSSGGSGGSYDSDSDDLSSHSASSCPSGQFNVPGMGCMLVQCPQGQHPVAGATLSDYPSCAYDGDSGSDSDSVSSSAGSGSSSGSGSGSGSTDSNDNGDVVAAINAFHADNNKNHQELMDDLNKKPADPDYTGMEGEFSSVVGGAMSGITDSVKSAWDAGKAAFGEGLSGIDSMLPDIKTSFDLPPGFEAASTGRCIPVVLDFDIKLVGIPDYHFHAVGTQVCLLYDKYIRPVLNFCMVILSFFVIHRLLIRSAEFLTDGRH
ncbi:TPA: hypothetical protein ACGT6A_005110 [Salmonella enterica]